MIEAKYSEAEIEEILTLQKDLVKKDIAQDTFGDEETTVSQKRKATHNHTWSFVSRINHASKLVFRDNLAMLNLFLLPASESHEEEFSLVGRVLDVDGNPLEGASAAIASLGLSVLTDADGRYAFAGLDTGSLEVTYSLSGRVSVTQTVENEDGETAVNDVVLVEG